MTIYWEIPDEIIIKVISIFKKDRQVFSTIEFIDKWDEMNHKEVVDYEKLRGRNWRAILGKRLKRYSNSSGEIRQITPGHISPARWEILNR
jgi:hypothetical protein